MTRSGSPIAPTERAPEALRTDADSSEVLRRLRPTGLPADHSFLFGDAARPLSAEEVTELEAGGSSAQDWAQVRVSAGFRAGDISNVRFAGTVVIGRTGEPVELRPGLTVASGLRDSTLADCEIGDGVLVDRVGLMHRMVLFPGSIVARTAEVVHEQGSSFGNGQGVHLICDPGGRVVPALAEMPFDLLAELAGTSLSEVTRRQIDERVRLFSGRAAAASHGVIAENARILSCGRLESVWIGPGARIENARAVVRSTVLSSVESPAAVLDGAVVRDSLLQWGTRVSDLAVVEDSVVCECAQVGRCGMLVSSILGPDSHLTEGEISKSVVGPFVGFHHQALLVAAYWPEGRGNVGHGANVGSNHTGRAPDQEIVPGEGAFFGLGVNIKMPADFSQAPYLLIATGVDTLPQRVEYPCSLIMEPVERPAGVPTAFNELRPGWQLYDNLYGLVRNERKYGLRREAGRYPPETEIFRPSLLAHVERAHTVLTGAEDRPWYGPGELPGLGKNFMSAKARSRGIEAYLDLMRWFGLRGAFRRLAAGLPLDPAAESEADSGRWQAERRLLLAHVSTAEPAILASLFVEAEERRLERVREGKNRDDVRGARVITDYAAVHPPVSEDPLVAFLQEELEGTRRTAERIRAELLG